MVLIVFVFAIIAIAIRKPPKTKSKRYDARGFDHNRIHKNGTKYDDFGFDYSGYNADGYDRHGYNPSGKNVKGQYNRFFDSNACSEDGFLSPDIYPIALTDHARMRIRERLGISDYQKMDAAVMDAYRFGKSKRQMKTTSAFLIDEIEQKHEKGIVLIYRNFIYIFSCENVLITVYRNDKIPL